jgi:hypothetical protein
LLSTGTGATLLWDGDGVADGGFVDDADPEAVTDD